MKSTFLRLLTLLLASLMLLTACTPAVTPDDTTALADTTAVPDTVVDETTQRETYEDLSHNVPEIQGADGKSSTAIAKGELTAPDVVLTFDGESGLFVVSSNIAEIHDTENVYLNSLEWGLWEGTEWD